MSQSPVHVFAKWQVKKDRLDEVLDLLTIMAAQSIAEDGNLFYRIHQSNTDPYTLLLFEGYKNGDAVAAHRNSTHFQTLVIEKIVPLLEAREVVAARELFFD